MTTGLVRVPEGTDMMAACTLVNWPLPSAATTMLMGLTADLPGATDWPPEFKARMANAHSAADSPVGMGETIRFIWFKDLTSMKSNLSRTNPTERRFPIRRVSLESQHPPGRRPALRGAVCGMTSRHRGHGSNHPAGIIHPNAERVVTHFGGARLLTSRRARTVPHRNGKLRHQRRKKLIFDRGQGFENFGSVPFGLGEVRAAVFALVAVHHPEFFAVGTGLPCRPFLHTQEGEEAGDAEDQIKRRPAQTRWKRKTV